MFAIDAGHAANMQSFLKDFHIITSFCFFYLFSAFLYFRYFKEHTREICDFYVE